MRGTKNDNKITAPARSLIVWNDKLAHCNYPNSGNTFRIVDYLQYERASECTRDLTRNLMKVGIDSTLRPRDSYFPRMLSDEQKLLIDFHKYNGLISSDKEVRGYGLYKQGCALECQGDITAAVALYQRAYKMCPLLEEMT